jgi:hypothetical protein
MMLDRFRWYVQAMRCHFGYHVWARRRDGRWCAYCEKIEFGKYK